MHNFIRYYYRNRIKVWFTILGIIFIFLVIQLFNSIAKKEEENSMIQNESEQQEELYIEESQSMVTEGSVGSTYSNKYGNAIETFFNYCINHQPELAYTMLSSDTKKILYNENEKLFETFYYNKKFSGDKNFSFQSWSKNGDQYIYQIKIYENMLSTGKADDSYIEDYVSIVEEDDKIKLNIDNFIGKEELNKQNSNNKVSITVVDLEKYMDYEIYTFKVKNNVDENILLDSRRKDNTVYVVDNNENKFKSFLYENIQDDLLIKAKEEKKIKIKFNFANREDARIVSVNFDDIICDINNMNENEELRIEL